MAGTPGTRIHFGKLFSYLFKEFYMDNEDKPPHIFVSDGNKPNMMENDEPP
jgi:hypothetical protein